MSRDMKTQRDRKRSHELQRTERRGTGVTVPYPTNLTRTEMEVDLIIDDMRHETGWLRLLSRRHRELDRQQSRLVRIAYEGRAAELKTQAEARVKALRELCVHGLIKLGVIYREDTSTTVLHTYYRLEDNLLDAIGNLWDLYDRYSERFADPESPWAARSERLIQQRLDALDEMVELLSASFQEVLKNSFDLQRSHSGIEMR